MGERDGTFLMYLDKGKNIDGTQRKKNVFTVIVIVAFHRLADITQGTDRRFDLFAITITINAFFYTI